MVGSGFGILYGLYYRANDAEYIQLTHNRPRIARLLRSVHIVPETVKEKVASDVPFNGSTASTITVCTSLVLQLLFSQILLTPSIQSIS